MSSTNERTPNRFGQEGEAAVPSIYNDVLEKYIIRGVGPVAIMGPSRSADNDATLLLACSLMHRKSPKGSVYIVEPKQNNMAEWRVNEGVAPGYGNLGQYEDQLAALRSVGVPLSPIIWQGYDGLIQKTQFSAGFLSTIVDHATAFFVSQRLGVGSHLAILKDVFFEYARILAPEGCLIISGSSQSWNFKTPTNPGGYDVAMLLQGAGFTAKYLFAEDKITIPLGNDVSRRILMSSYPPGVAMCEPDRAMLSSHIETMGGRDCLVFDHPDYPSPDVYICTKQ